jgi:hypothetical protein
MVASAGRYVGFLGSVNTPIEMNEYVRERACLIIVRKRKKKCEKESENELKQNENHRPRSVSHSVLWS